ncbi:hypothetical protein [Bailinhaonella thermotolerans]|uniref:hypothetical protein n=1 Tax=Bailinhaonella thermotolerans TaxID=1070861 RepID=UPI00192A1C44|nr:hypothetical protein [Bailinhaonella thermotolerans]
MDDTALAWARARALGPLPLTPGVPGAPDGMVRLERDGRAWALPLPPDGATPGLLEEYQIAGVPVERSGETRRVLAACLKCCWRDLQADPWPGEPAPVEDVLSVYQHMIGRSDDMHRNWALGALRRLCDSAWLEQADGMVRLGPRVAAWTPESHHQLRDLCRRLPSPAPPAAAPLPEGAGPAGEDGDAVRPAGASAGPGVDAIAGPGVGGALMDAETGGGEARA